MTRSHLIRTLIVLLCLAAASYVPSPPIAAGRDTVRLVREGQDLYRKGRLGEALIKFEEAASAGAAGGELFYQMGFAYKTVRQDSVKSKEYMTKAVPLLEAMEPKTPAPLYYLSAIHTIELGDSDKGKATAQRAIDLAEKGAFRKSSDGESLFQLARLHSLAGRTEEAIPFYERAVAALDKEKEPNRQYLANAVDVLAKHHHTKSDLPGASRWYQRVVQINPDDEQTRVSAGLIMIKAGDYEQAIAALSGLRDDILVTESNYVVRVVKRYVELGEPPVPPETLKMADADLEAAIDASARKLGEIRQKEETARPPEPTEPEYEWFTTKKGTKMKRLVPRYMPPPEDWKPKDPNNPTPQELIKMSGIIYAPPYIPPPPSPERIEAEKEFFGLLLERTRRGFRMREAAVQRGFASLLFR